MKERKYRNKEWLQEQFNKYITVSKIVEETGYPRTCITRYANKYEIRKSKFSRLPQNDLNEQYFDKIDSGDKAYFLGFIMADGNMYQYENGRLQFSIQIKSTDKDVIHKFARSIEFDENKVTEKIGKRNNTTTHSTVIKIYNKHFCESLIELGIVPKKTGKETMPTQIPECYIKDFIRGYVDGDGWVYKHKKRKHQVGACSTSLEILVSINNYLENKFGKMPKITKDDTVYKINICSVVQSYKVLKHLYYNDCIALDRKYAIAKEIIKDYEEKYF